MSNNIPPRVQKFLANRGVASRRMIEAWMREGRVLINQKPAKPGDTLREQDEITVLDVDRTVIYRATLRGVWDERSSKWLKRGFEYWAVNKPRGVLASTRDPHHKNMVTHLVPSATRVFPVGRLDKESEGLILLTSDGELCHRLTHPRFGVIKRYRVTLDRPPSRDTIAAVERGGVMLDDGPTLPVKVNVILPRLLELSMREGRKREIRRIVEHFGYRVVRLVRVGFGPVELGDLPQGKARELTSDEVAALRRAVKRPHQSVENRATERLNRRPASGRPGQRWGRRSSRSSARRATRKGSRS